MRLPAILLRLESLALLLAGVALYRYLGGTWGLFFALLLAPDLSMLGFLAGPRPGALAYNVVHTYVAPAVVAAIALLAHATPHLIALLCIWTAHIALDRLLGYGLKYPTGFRDTHLQRV